MLTVEKAAIKIADNRVFTVERPGRHCNVIWLIVGSGVAKRVEGMEEQGFILSDGRFVGREEAARVAFAAGQLNKQELKRRNVDPEVCPEHLYSEDV